MKLLDAFKERFVVKGRYPEISICCAYCEEDDFKLCLNLEKKVGQCFKCGAKLGSSMIYQLLGEGFSLQESADISKLEASIDSIAGQTSVQTPENIEIDGLRIIEFCASKNPEYNLAYNKAISYLNSRGFNPLEVSEKYSFMISSPYGRERGRLILPVFEDLKLVYYQARALFGQEPKYLNPPRSLFSKGKSGHIFNIDVACKYEEVVLCEGIFSAISVGDNAVAVFGKELSEEQITLLVKKRVRSVVILFDPGAEEFSLKAAEKLYPRFSVRIGKLEGGDPNEIPKESVRLAIHNSEVYNGDKIIIF